MPPRARRNQGQHLVDLVRLTYASRNVAKKHAQLRTAQWERLRRSSGAAQEVEVQLRQVFDGARAAAALVRRFLEEDAKDVWRAQEDVWKNKEAGRSEDGKSSLGESQQVEKKINEETKERSDLSETIKLNEDLEPPPGVDINVFRTKKVSQILSKENKGGRATPNTPISAASDEQQTRSSQHPMESLLGKNQSSIDADAQLKATQDSVPSEKVDAKDHHFQMRESRVPSTRFGRLWQYGGLATSMAFGAVGESLRRATGSSTGGSLVLGPRNMERLVAKLSRMRGAALKLGQMISFQDSRMLPPAINEVLQRVQDSADYMPSSQRDWVLAKNLGSEWRDLFSRFDEVPVAAASIGQVHRAVFKPTGQEVAVKVQYPGVAKSIDSDLNNLSVLLTASRLLPKGLFLDKTIANARTELAWECDYVREAECARRFKALLTDDATVFKVPEIIDEVSGQDVLTAEYMHGTAVTKIPHLTQDQRDWIGTNILRLCLREITEFKFMQTDPNWTNFLYNSSTQQIELLDFGASRDYPDEFIMPYIDILRASAHSDRVAVRDLSIKLGYLTGSESSVMANAHVDSVLTLAEPFSEHAPEVYDFRDQTITDRVRGLIPLMLKERLAPPPEETYSLHRKLSGAFLLCARLGSRVRCRELFAKAMDKDTV